MIADLRLDAWQLIYPIPGSTRPEGVAETLEALKVRLDDADLKAIRDVVSKADVVGGRYNDALKGALEG